jgi:hypothetical protein
VVEVLSSFKCAGHGFLSRFDAGPVMYTGPASIASPDPTCLGMQA